MGAGTWDNWVTGMPDNLAAAVRRRNDTDRWIILTSWDACDEDTQRRYRQAMKWTIPGMRRRSANRVADRLLDIHINN